MLSISLIKAKLLYNCLISKMLYWENINVLVKVLLRSREEGRERFMLWKGPFVP